MIRLISGLPGAGKSLRAVWYIDQAERAGRPVYVAGVDGLAPGGWAPCDPNRWHDLPDGSLVVIDEAQKHWPTRRVGDPPEYIRALSEHRHRGFDFLLVTQHPAMLDKYVRTLVGEHQHVIRQFGTRTAKIITWSECYDDPQSLATRQRGTESLWRYPKSLFGRYKSASVHTVKARIPARLVVLPLLVLVALYGAWKGYGVVTGIDDSVALPVTPTADLPRAGGPVAPGRTDPRTPADYVASLIPRVEGMPWTAPVFDEREVRAEPDIYCIEIADHVPGCQCYTEQITRLNVPSRQCRTIARHGVYNPFREPFREQEKGDRDVVPDFASSLPSMSASSATGGGVSGPRYRPISPASEGAGTW